MRKTLAALAFGGTIFLTGCGGTAADEPAEAPAPTGAAATDESAETVDTFDVKTGDCILYPKEQQQALEQATAATEAPMDVETVPCDRPHDSEVYAIFDLPDGDFPGEEEVIAAADEGCFNEFEPFVGNSYDNSVLDIEYFFPSQESWSFDGDRQVTCMVYHLEGEPLVGSARESAL
jgi:hypothetical protein